MSTIIGNMINAFVNKPLIYLYMYLVTVSKNLYMVC